MAKDLHDPSQEFHKEQKREASRHGRLTRRVMFFLGFSKCRHCIWCDFQGRAGRDYRTLRESIILQQGNCKFAHDKFSGQLSYEDLRTYHRCPGFIPVLYNFKGYGISREETKNIYERRWRAFVTWAGWVVAALTAILAAWLR